MYADADKVMFCVNTISIFKNLHIVQMIVKVVNKIQTTIQSLEKVRNQTPAT